MTPGEENTQNNENEQTQIASAAEEGHGQSEVLPAPSKGSSKGGKLSRNKIYPQADMTNDESEGTGNTQIVHVPKDKPEQSGALSVHSTGT